MSPTRVAIYVRISQDKTGGGLGVARQEKDCRALARTLGWDVVDVYVDNDLSAYSGKPRPQYLRLLDDIRAGSVDAVVCWHTDRLHRSPVELEGYIKVAESIPTHVVTAGVLDLRTPDGRLSARITGAVARHESEHKSERQRRKTLELAEAGKPLGGGRPFAYESDGMTIRETEAGELRAIVAKVLAGDSLASIMKDLNARQVLSTRGNPWVYSSLRALLLRHRNAGLMQHRGNVIGKASWPALVSETDHHAVAAILADPKRRTTSGNNRVHLLSGMVKCGVCGKGMRPGAITSRGKRYAFYQCRACNVSRSIPKVDAYVERTVLSLLDDVRITRALARRESADGLGALEAEREALSARLEGAADAYADGQITTQQLTSITAKVRGRLEDVQMGLTAAVRGTAIDGMLAGDGDVEARWAGLSLERKRQVVDALLDVQVLPVGKGRRGPQNVNKDLRLIIKTTGSTFIASTMPKDVQKAIVASLCT